jgi:hypothetical protein
MPNELGHVLLITELVQLELSSRPNYSPARDHHGGKSVDRPGGTRNAMPHIG